MRESSSFRRYDSFFFFSCSKLSSVRLLTLEIGMLAGRQKFCGSDTAMGSQIT